VPLVLRGLLYLKVEVNMKKEYELMLDYEEEIEEVDGLNSLERVWLDTGDGIVQLPDELIPYLQESDILGIA
jgi:hypothetical protein